MHSFGALSDPEGLIEVCGAGCVRLQVLQDLLVLGLVDGVDSILAFVVDGVPRVSMLGREDYNALRVGSWRHPLLVLDEGRLYRIHGSKLPLQVSGDP